MGILGAIIGGVVFMWFWQKIVEEPKQTAQLRAHHAEEAAYDAQTLVENQALDAQEQVERKNNTSQCLVHGHIWKDPEDTSYCTRCGVDEDALKVEVCRRTAGHIWKNEHEDEEEIELWGTGALMCYRCGCCKDLQCLQGHVYRNDKYGDIKCAARYCDSTPAMDETLMACAQACIASPQPAGVHSPRDWV